MRAGGHSHARQQVAVDLPPYTLNFIIGDFPIKTSNQLGSLVYILQVNAVVLRCIVDVNVRDVGPGLRDLVRVLVFERAHDLVLTC